MCNRGYSVIMSFNEFGTARGRSLSNREIDVFNAGTAARQQRLTEFQVLLNITHDEMEKKALIAQIKTFFESPRVTCSSNQTHES